MTHLQEPSAPTALSEGPQAAFSGFPATDLAPSDSEKAHQDFVRSLFKRVEGRYREPLDDAVQLEITKLIVLLSDMPRKKVAQNRVQFEAAFDMLGSDQPNLLLARGIRRKLQAINDASVPGITWLISRICGNTPLNAAISALLTAFVLAFAFLGLITQGHVGLVEHMDALSELNSLISMSTAELLVVMVHSAFLGGIVSITARIGDFTHDPTVSPSFIYISVIRKPFLAACFAILVFSVLISGLVSIPGVDLTGSTAPFVVWALGFVCGFSERLAEDFVVEASTRFNAPLRPAKRSPDTRNSG